MTSISNTISKAPSKALSKPAPLKLREMTRTQRTLACALMGKQWKDLYVQACLEADRNGDVDRHHCDVTDEARTINSSDVPSSKQQQFKDCFGDSLTIDGTFDITTHVKYDSNYKPIDGVIMQEVDDDGAVLSKTFVPIEKEEPDDATHDDGEMVAVPYASGKGATMHAWVPKKVAGDMMGH